MKNVLSLFFAVFAVLLVGCKGDGASSTSGTSAPGSAASTPSGGGTVTLTGQGATFPNPLYQKWISEYAKVEPGVKINYQAVGSGAGIKAISDKTSDFGASDAPMTDDQLKAAPAPLVHVPMTLGAVVVTYNLEGSPKLELTPEVLSGIFLGEITKWNDPKIAALNAGAKLPDKSIGVAYRSDGSGTTAVFTSYLAKVSSTWKDKVGTSTSVKWPVGSGAKGNDGVTNQVKSTPGAIGYVELVYALQNKLPVATLKNKAGKFVEPSLASITAAGAVRQMPDDMRVSIVDPEGDAAYPICAYTYILVYKDMADATKGAALAKFLDWALHDGQRFAAALNYGTLPDTVAQKADAEVKALTAGGKPLLK